MEMADPFAIADIDVSGSSSGAEMGANLTSASSQIYYPRGASVVAAIAAILFMVLGCLGNAVTILTLWKSQKLLVHATTWFVLSLCFSDLLFCAINLPLTASRYIHEEWVLGETLCRLFPFFFYGNVATSLFSMVAITINRYVLIAHYSSYDRIYQRKNIIAMIAFVWIFSFAMLVPPLFEIWGRLGLEPHTFSCTILKNADGRSPKKFLFVFGILIPCTVIIFCYSCIYFKVRQSRLNVLAHRALVNPNDKGADAERKISAQRRDDLRLTKMMLLIFCCFLLSFLPLLIFNVIDDEVKHPSLHVAASILAWEASVINPIIYAVTNRQYRLAYYDLFGCGNGYTRTSTQQPTTSRSGSGKTILTEMVPLPADSATNDEKQDRLLPIGQDDGEINAQ